MIPLPSVFYPPPKRARMPKAARPGQPEIPDDRYHGDPAWRSRLRQARLPPAQAEQPARAPGLVGLAGCGAAAARWAKGLLALSLGLALTATLLPVGNWLMRPLEDRFPRPVGYPDAVEGVVVLGGGTDVDVTAGRGVPAFTDPAERYMALLELARHYPPAVPVIFTGGIGRLEGGVPPETETVRLLLARHGLDGRVLLEDKARTTRENALYAKDLAKPRPGARWLLVTSAGHMPRSVGVFRVVDWDGLPGRSTTAPRRVTAGLRAAGRRPASTTSTRPPTSGSASPTTARSAGRPSCSPGPRARGGSPQG
jgi:uncharacterized SAM-binding protein YcdF (DUF218 family)